MEGVVRVVKSQDDTTDPQRAAPAVHNALCGEGRSTRKKRLFSFMGKRADRFYSGLKGFGLLGIHLGALAIFWPGVFHWSAFAAAAVVFYATVALGISLCFHRALTHRSLRLFKSFEYVLAIFGTLALQGDPIRWVAVHRKHHAHADREGDPHSIRRRVQVGAPGLDLPAQYRAADRRGDASLCARPLRAAILSGAPVPQYPASSCARTWTLCARRLVVAYFGHLRATGHQLSFDVAGEQRVAHVGISQLSDGRPIDQLLVGCDHLMGRRLAQQSSRLPVLGTARATLVRDRYDVVARPGSRNASTRGPNQGSEPVYATAASLSLLGGHAQAGLSNAVGLVRPTRRLYGPTSGLIALLNVAILLAADAANVERLPKCSCGANTFALRFGHVGRRSRNATFLLLTRTRG